MTVSKFLPNLKGCWQAGILLGFLAIFPLMTSCGIRPSVAFSDRSLQTVVCFGDSITEGAGAGTGEDFPSVLSRRLLPAVVNAGVSGNTTSDGLNRLERDVLVHNPDLVIIEFGGNDFLHQVSAEKALRNLEAIVSRLHEARAAVILLEVPYGLFDGSFNRGLKAIRKKYQTGFSPVLREVLKKPDLKSDQIHPNREGYQVIAEALFQEICTIYGERISKSNSESPR